MLRHLAQKCNSLCNKSCNSFSGVRRWGMPEFRVSIFQVHVLIALRSGPHTAFDVHRITGRATQGCNSALASLARKGIIVRRGWEEGTPPRFSILPEADHFVDVLLAEWKRLQPVTGAAANRGGLK